MSSLEELSNQIRDTISRLHGLEQQIREKVAHEETLLRLKPLGITDEDIQRFDDEVSQIASNTVYCNIAVQQSLYDYTLFYFLQGGNTHSESIEKAVSRLKADVLYSDRLRYAGQNRECVLYRAPNRIR